MAEHCPALPGNAFHCALQEGSRAPNAKHPDNLATGGDFDSGTTYGGQYVPKVGPSLLPFMCTGRPGAGTTNALPATCLQAGLGLPSVPTWTAIDYLHRLLPAGGFACSQRQAPGQP